MDKIIRKPQFFAQQPDFVLEKMIQRLQNGLELLNDLSGQELVVVALDDVGIPRAGLDDVGIDGALSEKVLFGDAEFHGFIQKYIPEFRANDLTLALGVFHALELVQEALLRVHPDKVDVPLGKGGFYLVALIFAHTAVIHEYRGQPIPYRLGQQRRQNGGIHAAGQRQQHATLGADGVPELCHGIFAEIPHRPSTLGTADFVKEVAQHLAAELGVIHLRVELNTVEAPALIGNGGIGAGVGMGDQRKALRNLRHVIAVAHPRNGLLRDALEQLAAGIVIGDGLAVLPGGILLRGSDLTAQRMRHQLAAVANAENGNPQPEHFRVNVGRFLQIHAVGAAGENDAHGRKGADLVQGCGVGLDLAVDILLPHPPGDQLIVLSAKVQNQDFFLHTVLSPSLPAG